MAHPGHRTQRTAEPGGFFTILRRSLAWLVLAPLVGLAAAAFLISSVAPTYTASGAVFVDPRSRKIVTDDIVQGGLGTDASLVESQIAIMTSKSVLERVLKAERLDEDPDFAGAPASGLVADLKALLRGPRPATDSKTKALESLERSVRVHRPAKSYVLEVEASSTTPAKAARIVNAVMQAYMDDQTAAKAEEAGRANALIDARIGELREQVRAAEGRLDEFRKASKIVLSEGGVVAEQQLGKLNIELATARSVAAEAHARAEQAHTAAVNGAPEELPEAVKSGLVQKLREQYAQVARREAALSAQLKRRHPVLVDVRSQLAELKTQIGDELQRIAASASGEEAIATARDREVLAAVETAKNEVARLNTAQIKMRELEQDVATSRELLGAFMARAKETLEQVKLSTPEARIITAAAVPTRPSFPTPALFLALGFIGGLGLAIGRALVGDALDRSARAADSPKPRFDGLPTLATLPAVGRASSWLFGRRGRSGVFADILAAVSEPKTAGASAYRQAIRRLLGTLLAGRKDGGPRIVALTSPRSGAGTSSTALALAYTSALDGERTLLVDADSIDADLSEILAPAVDAGTVVVLDSKDDLARITTHDVRTGLSFLPIALADIRRLKASQRRRLVEGLQALATSYDLVLIDAGALIEDESARALLPLADRILLVAAAGQTPATEIEEAGELIDPVTDADRALIVTTPPRGRSR